VRGETASKDAKVSAQLGDLRQWLHAVHDNPGAQQGSDPSSGLLLTARDLVNPYSKWVQALAQGAKGSASSKRAGRLSARWRREVAATCQRSFSNKLPFANGADSEASLRDFENFYARNGILDSFVGEYLQPLMDKNDGSISSGTRASIRHAGRIREAFFDGGETLGFNYQLTGFDVDDRIGQLVIESGKDQRVRFKHGPPVPLKLSWPDGDEGLKITFMRKDGSTERRVIAGPWAIFQAVAMSRQGDEKRYANADRILVTFTDGAYRAVFQLTTDRDVSPFSPGLLDGYRCRSGL
jgi:type VI secretion system protein ImpL